MTNGMIIWIVAMIAVIGVLVAVTWQVWRRRQLREWLRTATVDDVINTTDYERELRGLLQQLNDERAKATADAVAKGGNVRNHPMEILLDEGVFNAEDMRELYIHSLQKTLIGYPKSVRTYIKDVGTLAYQRCVMHLMQRAGMKEIQVKKEA